MLRGLTIVMAAAALLYGGYWFAGRGTAEAALTQAAAELRERGWDVGWDTLVTRGFPSRFDTTLGAPHVAGPDGRFAWSAPTLQLLALAYRPTQVIALFPERQTLTLDGEPFEVAATAMRASATVRASTDLPLADATVELGATRLDGPRLAGGFEAGLFALRRAADASYDAFGRLTGVTLPEAAAQAGMPTELERIEVDALLTLAAPLDRGAIASGLPRAEALELRHLTLVWGPVTLTASGPLAVAGDGRLSGSLALEVVGWRRLIDAAAAAGWVDEATAEALSRAGGLATLGSDEALALDLAFRDGRTYLGPLPLGPAPMLVRGASD